MSFRTFLLVFAVCFLQNVCSQCIGPFPCGDLPLGYGPGLYGPGPLAGPLTGPVGPLGAYGGSGVGQVFVVGELPVAGTTLIAGQVPILGAVDFAGIVPSAGVVTISGACSCGCSIPLLY